MKTEFTFLTKAGIIAALAAQGIEISVSRTGVDCFYMVTAKRRNSIVIHKAFEVVVRTTDAVNRTFTQEQIEEIRRGRAIRMAFEEMKRNRYVYSPLAEMDSEQHPELVHRFRAERN